MSVETLFIISIILNLAFNDLTINFVLGMIRALQIIIHLPLLRIYLQANLNMVFSIIIPIIMFDIMDSDQLSEYILDYDHTNQELLAEGQYGQIVDLGYTSSNSILNLGTLSIVFIFYFVRIILLLLLIIYTKITTFCPYIHKYRGELQNTLFFSEVIKTFIEGYFEFLISCYFAIKTPLMTKNGEILSVIIGYSGLIIAMLLPLTIIIFLIFFKIDKFK